MVCRGIARDESTKNCEKVHRKPKELPGKGTRFFKIMFGEDYSKLLYLPPKFAKTVQHLTDQRTQLEDACGHRWYVTLSKVKGSLAFQKGWPEFFQDHGLEQGEFLTFKYIKGSHFVVRVFDKAACERSSFSNEMPQQSKRARRDQDTASEVEPFQIADVNSGDKPASATSVASGSKFLNCHADVAVTNADVRRMQLPVSMKMEDPICMINRDDEHLQREDRNFLNDLSSFEIQNKYQKVLYTELDASRGQIGSVEQTKTLGNDVHSSDIFTDKLEKSLDAKLDPSCGQIWSKEQTKTLGDDVHSNDILTDKLEKSLDAKLAPSLAKSLDAKLDPSCGQTGSAEQTKTLGDDVHSNDIFTDKFENSLDAKLASSHTDITERRDDDEMDVIQTNQVNARSGDIVVEKALETKTVHSYAEPTKLATKKDDDHRMAAICPSQNAGHSGATSMFKKPSENINLSKGMLDDFSIFQNESYSGSPSIGSSKIAEGLHVANRRCHDSSVSSSILKDPFVKHEIKKEQVEMEDEAYCYGKKPTIWSHDWKFSPAVKVEPDLLNDIGPSRNILPFSAEVKSKSYLELPPELDSDSLRGWRDKGRGKIVYLKDSIGRIWPVFFQDKYHFKAFTTNWTNFCDTNNIKPGDKCRFQVEKVARLQFRVDIFRASDESLLK